jgi:uncharacterized protein YfaQ (DUF2300 family)
MTTVVTMATVVAVAMSEAADASPAMREATETAEAEPGSVDGQRAVEASVTHRAERTEAAIVADVMVVTFMGVTPASKQMHGAVPR